MRTGRPLDSPRWHAGSAQTGLPITTVRPYQSRNDCAGTAHLSYGSSKRSDSGAGGEHTPIGADGTVDISPSARLFIKESAIVQALYDGLKLLLDAEKAAAPAEA